MYSKLQDGSFMVCGFVARDAETKKTQTGKTLTNFSVKVADVPTADGNKEAKWTNCQAWHDVARVAQSIKKGDVVLAVGKMQEREHEGKKYKNLVCEFISIMSPPTAQSAPVPTAPPPTTQQYVASNQSILAEYEDILGGDVPF